MQKLQQINNDIYLLMQDITKLISRNPHTIDNGMVEVNINISDLIFQPKVEQLQKALRELQFLKSEWIDIDKESSLIYFINEIKFSVGKIIRFKLSSLELANLKLVNYNLNKYIDDYIE